MICLSDKIIEAGKNLGFVVENFSLSNALKFITKKCMVSIFGADVFCDDDLVVEQLGNGYRINFVNDKSLYISSEKFDLLLETKGSTVRITRTKRDDFIGCVYHHVEGNTDVSDVYHVFPDYFSYSRNVDRGMVIRVSASFNGLTKSGHIIYDIKQSFPIPDEESLLKRIASSVNGNNIVSIAQSSDGLTVSNYSELYSALNEKFDLEKKDDKTRVLEK